MSRRLASPLVRPTSEQEWVDLLTLLPGYNPLAGAEHYTFNEDKAWGVIDFFQKHLRHVKGEKARTPFLLERWQACALCNLHGWLNPDGTRRYREFLQYVARKNGKTPTLAGMCLHALCFDGEFGAEVYSAASDREQASLIFHHADGMVMLDPALKKRLTVSRGVGQRTIAYRDAMSTYQVIDALPDGAHGLNIHFCAVDELHAQKNRDLVDVLQTATGARAQPLLGYITTADYQRASICNEKYEHARTVQADPSVDPEFLPIIYEATAEDDWTTEAAWAKANPNLGVSIKREYLQRECRKAQRNAAYENTFKRLHLNIRTEVDTLFIRRDVWMKCGPRDGEPLDPILWRQKMLRKLKGRVAWGGLDLGENRDLTAFVAVVPPQDGDPLWYVIPWFWVPEETMRERSRTDRADYYQWVRDGFIYLTPKATTDYRLVRSDITEKIAPRFAFQDIAYDRYKATEIIMNLGDDGLQMVAYPMTAPAMNGPMVEIDTLVAHERLNHGNNPVLTWNAMNVVVETDTNENMRPNKRKSPDRIDGFVATLMALGRAIVQESEPESPYAERGIR
jgi:phage terminase large subunit-like protein